jgi:hypothetical protein
MAFVMRQGEGKGSALYTRCADEKYCQAELLLLLDKAPLGPVVGFYDVDPSFPVSMFLRSYQGREDEINRALERVRRGEFNFQEDGVMNLVPGVEQKSPNVAEKKRRMDTVVATVEHYLPEFAKGVKKAAKEATYSGQEEQPMLVLHQDAFAAGYHKDEYILLGLAIKYAGLHNVAVTIIGKNE